MVNESVRAHIQLIDVDQHPEIAKQYEAAAFPTFVLIEDGKERARHVGLATEKTIVDLFAKRSKAMVNRNTPQANPTDITPLVTLGGVSVKPVYESVNGITSQPTDEHLRHHGYTDDQIRGMRYEDRAWFHGIAHQLQLAVCK
jgi:hypothetical protein